MARPIAGASAPPSPPSPNDLIPLAQLPRELRAAADLIDREQAALSRVKYQTIYGYVVDGSVPAERVGGRWAIRRRDLGAVAEALGIRTAQPGRPRKAASPSNAAVAA